MSTKTSGSLHASRRSLFAGSAAMLATAGLSATAKASNTGKLSPIARLGRQLHAWAVECDRIGQALVHMPDGPERDALDERHTQLLNECLDLYDPILALPATNLEDVAIQITVSHYKADLVGEDITPEEAEDLSKELRRLYASVLPVIVSAAGIDIDGLGGGDMRHLCSVHAPRRGGRA